MNITQIKIDSVDTDYTPFTFSFGFELNCLLDSIQKIGVVNPPVLKKKGDRLLIVTGYKRILALKELGLDRVGGIILSEEVSDLRCLEMSIYDNVCTRKLNEVEKAILISKLSKYISPEQIIDTYFPLLDLPKRRQTYEFYLWISRLSYDAKRMLALERISIKALRLLYERERPEEEINLFVELLKKIRFSFNYQLQLIELIGDICRKEKKSLAQLLEEEAIFSIIESKSLTNDDKVKKIMEILRKRNFPHLYEAQEKFEKEIRKLGLPEGVIIKASPYFESPYFGLEIKFRNGEELRVILSKLSKIEGLFGIKAPWKR